MDAQFEASIRAADMATHVESIALVELHESAKVLPGANQDPIVVLLPSATGSGRIFKPDEMPIQYATEQGIDLTQVRRCRFFLVLASAFLVVISRALPPVQIVAAQICQYTLSDLGSTDKKGSDPAKKCVSDETPVSDLIREHPSLKPERTHSASFIIQQWSKYRHRILKEKRGRSCSTWQLRSWRTSPCCRSSSRPALPSSPSNPR